MNAPLKLGVAGLGTVGSGLLQLLASRASDLDQALGRPVRVVGVSARDRTKARGISLGDATWFDDPVALAASPAIDVFVELIGGEGMAADAVRAALGAGKHVVTANKALIAAQGAELAALAEKAGLALNFEASAAGGIPIVKALREGLAGNVVSRVAGILNGTCNYILTQMEETGRPFIDVLAEAQALGYAEADPSFDVDGIDAAHKLTLLIQLAFGARVPLDAVHTEGIRDVDASDMEYARELGYAIKLLAIAKDRPGDALGAVVGRTLSMEPEILFEGLDPQTARAYSDRTGPESPLVQWELLLPRTRGPIRCPVLVIGTPDDRLVRPADVARTAADYGTEPIWFPGMGHDVMLDRGWEDVLATVLDFAGHLPAWGTAPPR